MAVFVMLTLKILTYFSQGRRSAGATSIWGKSQMEKLANRSVGARRIADSESKRRRCPARKMSSSR
jgi:hypothetical protein